MVIGHEMTHGFDDQGSKYGPTGSVKYNADGTMGSWFTPEDLTKFNDRTKCIADEYSGFNVAPGQNLNGQADAGRELGRQRRHPDCVPALQEVMAKQGISPASMKDGYTPAQRFFISFGQVWCAEPDRAERTQPGQDRPALHRQVADGWHGAELSMSSARRSGARSAQPMMPTNSCQVW